MDLKVEDVMQILELAQKLPDVSYNENIERLEHVKKHGHILILRDEGRVVAYAGLYRMKEAPPYPVIPYPVDDPEGEYLYCYAASCEKGRIKELIDLAKRTFS